MKRLRTLALLLALVLVSHTAHASLALAQARVNARSASSVGSLGVAMGSSPTAGNLIVAAVTRQGTSITSVTDTWGNTYTATTAGSFTNGTISPNALTIYYAKNIAGSGANTVTANFSGTTTYSAISVYEISGADTSAPFVVDATASDPTSTAISSGTLSLGGVNAIIIAVYESDGAGGGNATPTPLTGYTQGQGDALKYYWDSYHIVSANEAAGATALSGKWGILAAAFKEATVGAAGTGRLLTLGAGE